MKIASFNEHQVGVVTDSGIIEVTHLLPAFLAEMPRQRINWLITHWGELRGKLANAIGTPVAPDRVTLLAANPGAPQIYAAPANYRKHIGELGERAVTTGGRSAREQGFFLKAPASLIGAGQPILLPRGSARRFDHESELAVIIGKAARNVHRNDAMQYVFGYSCLIDATMRIEKPAGEEERTMRKSFETFTPMGPYLVTADEVPDSGRLRNRLWVNDELRQDANTSEMIVPIAELIEMISSVLPLQPGDVIASGTPEGVGPIAPGDLVRIEIESVGTMTLSVQQHAQRAPRAY